MKPLFFILTTKDKMFFARHLSVMSRAGVSTIETLDMMKIQTRSRAFKKVLDELIEGVRNGRYLSDVLAKYERTFGEFFVNIVRVGEVSGTLADNLEYLANSLKKRKELESKVRGALVYPVIILLATLAVTAVMTFFIFPKILPIFKTLRVDLPLPTRVFIGISSYIFDHGLATLGAAILGLIGFWLVLRIVPIRKIWHHFLLLLPVIGSMIKNYNLVIFARSMHLLLKSGTRIVQAIEITSRTAKNLVYRDLLLKISTEINKGDLISNHMKKQKKYFPAVFTQMIAVGEKTGRLSETGVYLADYYEEELDSSTKALSNILEPILLIGMGLIVSFIAIAIILPIYSVTENFGR